MIWFTGSTTTGSIHVIERCGPCVSSHADRRSGEIDVVIYDKQQNALVSTNPLWVAAETLLAYVEVKTNLTKSELEKSYEGAKKIDALRPFKREFTLAGQPTSTGADDDQSRGPDCTGFGVLSSPFPASFCWRTKRVEFPSGDSVVCGIRMTS